MKEFKHFEANEKLDAVLAFIYENQEVRYPDISAHFYKKEANENMLEIYSIVECLVADGFAERPHDAYRLTFRGSVFIENKGYSKQEKLKLTKEKYDKIQTLALTIGSILAGIGTILLFAVEVYKIATHFL